MGIAAVHTSENTTSTGKLPKDAIAVNPIVKGQSLTMKLDTGSVVSIIPASIFKDLFNELAANEDPATHQLGTTTTHPGEGQGRRSNKRTASAGRPARRGHVRTTTVRQDVATETAARLERNPLRQNDFSKRPSQPAQGALCGHL